MKILLVSSFNFDSVSRIDIAPPLNLLYIAAVLRKSGVSVELYDLNLVSVSEMNETDEERLRSLRSKLMEYKPDMLGISCLTTAHFPFMRRVAAAAKQILPAVKIVIGGVHASLFAKEILENCSDFDFIIIGEGEEQITQLSQAIEGGSLEDLSSIQSLGWVTPAGKVVLNKRKNYIENLDSLPMPAWDLVDFDCYYRDHSNWYNPKNHDIKISIPILSTRSCPYDCNFCSAYATMGRGFRKHSPRRVVDEIEYHINRYNHNYFGFADDNLTLDKKHVLGICEEISRRGLDIQFESFNGYNLASLDEEVVNALASVGCIYAILPIEHGSDWMRNKIIGKKLPQDKIFEVMNLYKKHKIQTRAMFIMGFPEDTSETLGETLKMIEELGPDMADVFTLIPFPGTRVFRQVVEEGLLVENIDESQLWAGMLPLNTKGNEFYIKPAAMALDELAYWRKTFDNISAELIGKRKK